LYVGWSETCLPACLPAGGQAGAPTSASVGGAVYSIMGSDLY